MNSVARLLDVILKESLQIEEHIKSTATDNNKEVYTDIKDQLGRLLTPGFLATVPFRWLDQYPRYLKAIQYRIDKLKGNMDRDKVHMVEVLDYSRRLFELDDPAPEVLQEYRWMLEEYRVSLFAQPVGTSVPVSAKRLEKEWQRSFTTVAGN
jgi:ATP-dependent helicase HrpA